MQYAQYLLLALCVLLLSPAVRTHGDHGDHDHDDTDESDVVVLTKDNFDEIINDNEFVFVEFYAPWCGHCKRLVPDWAKLATKLKADDKKVVVAKLDATQAEEVAQKHSVRGYPTIKFFRSGTASDYEGGRTTDEMYAYAVRKSGPVSRLISTAEELESFVAGVGSKVISFLKGTGEDDKSHSNWIKAASSGSLEDFSIGHIIDEKLFGENKADTFVIHKEGESVTYTDSFIKSKIVKFIESEGYPLVDELAQKIWQRSQSTQTPLFAGFIEADNKEQKEFLVALAKAFKGKVLISQSTQTSLAERWGSSGKVIPTAILVQWVNGDPKMVVFNEEGPKLDIESATSFINEAIEGKYKSFQKSEPVPENNNGPVKTLVRKNFDEIVFDKSKDVFVEFYAPWCGHCKKLTPIWEELGELFEDNDNVVIAKMDATANSSPEGVDIKGYPTLIFFPADNKSGEPYSGERDLDSLVKFVKEKSSHTVGEDKVEL